MRATSFQEASSGALDFPEQRFEAAIDITRQAFVELHERSVIIGATIFGSAVSRLPDQEPDIDLLSDLDVIAIIPDSRNYRGVRELRKTAQAVLGQTAVALELSWFSEDQARAGEHNLLPPMHNWLRSQRSHYPAMTVGIPPADVIKPLEIDLEQTMQTWFRSTQMSLQKANQSPHSQLPFALSVTHIAARKSIDILRVLDIKDQLQLSGLPDLLYTKREVARSAHLVYGQHDPELFNLYQELGLIKRAFVGFLTNVVAKDRVTKEGYNATIQEMADDAVPKAADVLHRMHRQFSSIAAELPNPSASAQYYHYLPLAHRY